MEIVMHHAFSIVRFDNVFFSRGTLGQGKIQSWHHLT